MINSQTSGNTSRAYTRKKAVSPKSANKETESQTPLTEAAPVKIGETPLEVVDTGV